MGRQDSISACVLQRPPDFDGAFLAEFGSGAQVRTTVLSVRARILSPSAQGRWPGFPRLFDQNLEKNENESSDKRRPVPEVRTHAASDGGEHERACGDTHCTRGSKLTRLIIGRQSALESTRHRGSANGSRRARLLR